LGSALQLDASGMALTHLAEPRCCPQLKVLIIHARSGKATPKGAFDVCFALISGTKVDVAGDLSLAQQRTIDQY